MKRPALLDVNVLIALFDPDHLHHESAHLWFAEHRTAGCLRTFCESGHHRFWPDDVSLRDGSLFTLETGHRQLTDVYLLGLAVRHGGRLATFDRSIPARAVREGGPEHVVLIEA